MFQSEDLSVANCLSEMLFLTHFLFTGFETAVDEAQRAINAAYVEAHSFPDCVGVVKLSTSNHSECDA